MRRFCIAMVLLLLAASGVLAGETAPPALQLERMTVRTPRQVITLDPTGLPAQVEIKADPTELPLDKRHPRVKVDEALLAAIGRGKQLRAPMRLEVK